MTNLILFLQTTLFTVYFILTSYYLTWQSAQHHPSLDKCTLITDKPEIEQEETFIHTGEGDQTEVICIIHSSPHAEVSWFKDGLPLDQTNHVINQRGNRHTLTIAQVDSSKFGQYTCKASNQYGEDEKTTEVSGNQTLTNNLHPNSHFNLHLQNGIHKYVPIQRGNSNKTLRIVVFKS